VNVRAKKHATPIINIHKTNPKPTPLDLPTRRVWALVTLMSSFLFLAAALASAFMKNRIEKSASSEIHVLATTLSAHVEQTLHSADGILASMFAEASKAANTPAEFSAYFHGELGSTSSSPWWPPIAANRRSQ
jgi:hypothetical protein